MAEKLTHDMTLVFSVMRVLQRLQWYSTFSLTGLLMSGMLVLRTKLGISTERKLCARVMVEKSASGVDDESKRVRRQTRVLRAY